MEYHRRAVPCTTKAGEDLARVSYFDVIGRFSPNHARISDSTAQFSVCEAVLPGRMRQEGRYLSQAYWADAFAACSIKRATSSGLETYTAWLPGTSIVSAPARLAILRSRSGLMLRSFVAISAQLFF